MVVQPNGLHERLAAFSTKELMDALMVTDLPMGGTNAQRINRLLSVASPLGVTQFFQRDVPHPVGT